MSVTSIDLAPHGGISDSRDVSYEEQCPGSSCEFVNNSFTDDVGQYLKSDNKGLLATRNQAWNLAVPNDQTPLVGKQDSDPVGG